LKSILPLVVRTTPNKTGGSLAQFAIQCGCTFVHNPGGMQVLQIKADTANILTYYLAYTQTVKYSKQHFFSVV